MRRFHASTCGLEPSASIERFHSYRYSVEGEGKVSFMSDVKFDLEGWLENGSNELSGPKVHESYSESTATTRLRY